MKFNRIKNKMYGEVARKEMNSNGVEKDTSGAKLLKSCFPSSEK